LIDKPGGLTSHDVVARVRRAAGQKRVGHAGTLDPLATGLLAVLLGPATRLAPYLAKMDTVYRGRLEFGLSTDTDDLDGRGLARRPGPWPDEELVRRALSRREGEGEQVPPAFSALKVAGRRAHRAARAGEPLELAPRRVTAYRLEFLAYEPPFLEFRAEVSSGYYIRSLVRDLGADVGPGAALAALRRERVGPWSLAQAVRLADLAEWSPADWRDRLLSPAEALPHLPAVVLAGETLARFGQGQTVAVTEPTGGGPHKVLDPEGNLRGLGEFTPTSLGGGQPRGPFLRPLRVFGENRPDDHA
jgi:tRNA pseudouridine55 synthase